MAMDILAMIDARIPGAVLIQVNLSNLIIWSRDNFVT